MERLPPSFACARPRSRTVSLTAATKCALTLKWKDFEKEVLVTLNDRTEMKFPLLVGRNYLQRDFLVDVDIDNLDQPLAEQRDES